jgi:hypothetical protein
MQNIRDEPECLLLGEAGSVGGVLVATVHLVNAVVVGISVRRATGPEVELFNLPGSRKLGEDAEPVIYLLSVFTAGLTQGPCCSTRYSCLPVCSS